MSRKMIWLFALSFSLMASSQCASGQSFTTNAQIKAVPGIAQSSTFQSFGTVRSVPTGNGVSASFIADTDFVAFATTPTPPPPTPTTVTTGSSSSGGGHKYDASKWVLARKYDQLVKERDSVVQKSDEKASAPLQEPAEKTTPVKTEPTEIPSVLEKTVPTQESNQENVTTPSKLENLKTSIFDEPAVGESTQSQKVSESEKVKNVSSLSNALKVDIAFQTVRPTDKEILEEIKTRLSQGALSGRTNKQEGSLLRSRESAPEMQTPLRNRFDRMPLVTRRGYDLSETKDRDCAYLVDRSFYQEMIVWIWILVGLTLLNLLLIGFYFSTFKKLGSWFKKNFKKLKKFFSAFILVACVLSACQVDSVFAASTTPSLFIYEGTLMDSSHQPLTGSYDFRFSFWNSADYNAGDVVAGLIDELNPNYLAWKETQTQTVDAYGKFSFEIGKVNPLDFTIFNRNGIYIQIEVKKSTDPVTSFELLDVNVSDAAVDRMVFDTIPYAYNADMLDHHDLGYAAGEIPYLDGTAKLPVSIIPVGATSSLTGVDGNTFTLDADGNALPIDNLSLVFGNSIGKSLTWNNLLGQFIVNDDFKVQGNLVVTGTINGIPFGSRNEVLKLTPIYVGSVFDQDGTDNSGTLEDGSETSGTVVKNFFQWTTKKAALQDYDIVVRYVLPQDFVSFVADPVSFDYKTEGTVAQSKVDFTIEKEGALGTDQFSGSGTALNAAAWTTTDFNFIPATPWAAGDTLVFRIKMFATDTFASRVSDITIRYLKQ